MGSTPLYVFKTKAMTKLALYKPKTKREAELRDYLITYINNLRSMGLPRLVLALYEIIEHENVSDEFKDICHSILEDLSALDFALDVERLAD